MSKESKIMMVIALVIVGGMIALFAVFNSSGPSAANKNTADTSKLARSTSPKLGSGTKVTLVEFADFQCPACRAVAPDLERIVKDYPNEVSLVFRHFPLPMHTHARAAAQLAEVAGTKGKFWETYRLLYQAQDRWAEVKDPAQIWSEIAASQGLDLDEVAGAISVAKYKAVIDEGVADGQALGVDATPTLFVNGKKLNGFPDYATLKQAIEAELKRK